MNLTLAKFTLNMLFRRPLRIGLIVLFVIFGMSMASVRVGSEQASDAGHLVTSWTLPIVAILASGIIGQDSSDGILPLLLSRPVKRWNYVITKWLTTVFAILTVLMLIFLILNIETSIIFHCPLSGISMLEFAQVVVNVVGYSSVYLILSSLCPGFLDLGVVVALVMIGMILSGIDGHAHQDWLRELSSAIFRILCPSTDLADIKSLRSLFTFDFASYVCEVVLCISGAIYILNKKELSYGGE